MKNYEARLNELNEKLMKDGLTRTEEMELDLIHTMLLISARDSLKK